jgi:predicted dehydrogenase
MRFLIAGLGSIGRRHLRNLIALGESDILLYRTHRSTLPDSDLAGFPVETDLEAALGHQPDAVIVANPTACHFEVAIPAARSGCHLLLEKPVSHNLKGIETLQEAVQQSGSRVLVGYQYRFHPGLQKVIELLREGAIGRPLTARAHWGEYLPGWHPWEDYRSSYSARSALGGGVVLTLSHPLDYLLWMFGEAERVTAYTGKLSDLELDVEDTAEIIIEFKQGPVASLHLDYIQRPSAHRLEIIGSQGTLCWDQMEGSIRLHRAPTDPSDSSDQWEVFPLALINNPEKPFERNDLFMAEMKHFLDVVNGNVASRCSLEDGIFVLEVALAAYKAAQTKHTIDLKN